MAWIFLTVLAGCLYVIAQWRMAYRREQNERRRQRWLEKVARMMDQEEQDRIKSREILLKAEQDLDDAICKQPKDRAVAEALHQALHVLRNAIRGRDSNLSL